MCSGLVPLALLCACFAQAAAWTIPNNVTVWKRQVLVNGVPVHLKGVNWNPIPVGKTHPFDLDYLGYVERDSQLMEEAGINAIRSYECICDTRVLDVLWRRGIYVLNTVFAYAGKPMENVTADVDAVKDHPAVLMWVLGNEWNYNGCYFDLTHDECMAKIVEAAHLVKQHDKMHPVASIYGRLPKPEVLANMSVIDVWGTNFYAGLNFTTEELGGYNNLFLNWANISTLPLFIGEYGSDAWDTIKDVYDEDSQAIAIDNLAREVMDNSTLVGGVCLGGMIFEFADEWWKSGDGTPFTHDTKGYDWGGGPYPDMRFNEEWWGLLDIDRNPRPAYFAYKNVPMPKPRARLLSSAPLHV